MSISDRWRELVWSTRYDAARIWRWTAHRVRHFFLGTDSRALTKAQIEESKLRRELRQSEGHTLTGWLIWLGLAAILAITVVNGLRAVRMTRITIEPFEVPGQLVQQGYNGRVVANRILDELARFRDRDLGCNRPQLLRMIDYSNSWDPELDVEIPSTGLSLGDLDGLLRRTFRTSRRFRGELTISPSGTEVAVTARMVGSEGRTFRGARSDLDKLLRSAAWSIIEESEPLGLAIYLGQDAEHRAESYRILLNLARSNSPEERKWGLYARGVRDWQEGEFGRVEADLAAALALDPSLGDAHFNYGVLQEFLGHPEQALLSFRSAEDNTRTGPCVPTGEVQHRLARIGTEIAFLTKDAGAVTRRLDEVGRISPAMAETAADWSRYARAMLHDPDRSIPPIDPDPQNRMYAAESLLEAEMSLAGEHIAQSAEELLNSSLAWFAASRRSPATKRRAVAEVRRTMLPLVARALASSDQVPRAARLLEWADDDSYETKIAKGVVAAAARNLPAARVWFDRARLQAPSIADADHELGRALLDAGDYGGAVASFRRANALAPNWADPLKGWADALVAQRRYAEANEQYAAAARSAPRWGRLQIEWGRSLWLAGRRAEGLAKLREATRLQLSAADQVSADFYVGIALRAMAAPSPQRPQ